MKQGEFSLTCPFSSVEGARSFRRSALAAPFAAPTPSRCDQPAAVYVIVVPIFISGSCL